MDFLFLINVWESLYIVEFLSVIYVINIFPVSDLFLLYLLIFLTTSSDEQKFFIFDVVKLIIALWLVLF